VQTVCVFDFLMPLLDRRHKVGVSVRCDRIVQVTSGYNCSVLNALWENGCL
jgi:hypothetical protein